MKTRSAHPRLSDFVAVVGASCRLPGASDPDRLWRVLRDGVDTVGEVPPGRPWVSTRLDPERRPGTIVTRRGGFIDGIDLFDAGFFGVAPREAAFVDPQQRLLLEVGYEAFEDAGFIASRESQRLGVFVGQWTNDYYDLVCRETDARDLYTTLGGGRYASSGRLAHFFDARGPAVTVDTHCSSALVALHMASQSIRLGECSAALVGAASLILDPHISLSYSRSGLLSTDGRCKFGDQSANGYVRSEGVVVLAIKRLDLALADGDPVRAVVVASGVNNDGRSGRLLVSPSHEGQEALMHMAYRDRLVQPDDVTYIEAHGTGTAAGDLAELTSIHGVFGHPSRGRPCRLGSVKSNLGHCEAAAGLAGMLKAVLCLQNDALVPTLHVRQPTTAFDWGSSPLQLQGNTEPWPTDAPRVCAVNAFGITGTNAHVAVSSLGWLADRLGADSPELELLHAKSSESEWGLRPKVRILPLSARTAPALRELSSRLAQYVENAPSELDAADLCHTMAYRRPPLALRRAMVGTASSSFASALRQAGTPEETRPEASQRLGFVFGGQGTQFAGMCKALLKGERVFREKFREIDDMFGRCAEWSMSAALESGLPLDDTAIAQPCLFAVQVALATLRPS